MSVVCEEPSGDTGAHDHRRRSVRVAGLRRACQAAVIVVLGLPHRELVRPVELLAQRERRDAGTTGLPEVGEGLGAERREYAAALVGIGGHHAVSTRRPATAFSTRCFISRWPCR